MKNKTRLNKLFASALVMGCTLGFASCDNDDTATPPTIVSTQSMYGDYTGVMTSLTIVPYEEESTDTPEGTAITATVDNDTIYLTDFPIKDIVLSIVKDETMADQIVEAVGQVSYKVGYKGTLNAAKDSVHFSTATKPLKLAVQIPSATNSEETQALVVEVSVDPVAGGAYSVEDSEVEFSLNVTEVKLGEGENQEPLPNFNGMTLNFDMTQDKVTAHQ